ncbi:hypothetical protein [Natronomonas sp.]|jgi:hypothetical protein|uniref:hypothetical protein n=1 Tax=Natronomonas sp. TaxID=2184060 RepID=UPI0039898667
MRGSGYTTNVIECFGVHSTSVIDAQAVLHVVLGHRLAQLLQEDRDGSLDEQMADVREYAADHLDLRLVTTLNEWTSTPGLDSDREKYN